MFSFYIFCVKNPRNRVRSPALFALYVIVLMRFSKPYCTKSMQKYRVGPLKIQERYDTERVDTPHSASS